MSDAQDRAEALDDDRFTGEFPPDQLIGAEAYGAAGADPGAPEGVIARAAREEPEVVPQDAADEPYSPDDLAGSGGSVEGSVQDLEAPLDAEDAAMHLVDDPVFDDDDDEPPTGELSPEEVGAAEAIEAEVGDAQVGGLAPVDEDR
ncbi:MAG TPA: hypothetical protein P5254_00285 [Aquihabitans sp.]|nr:hypothetical protein [Aquihabitans sp.]